MLFVLQDSHWHYTIRQSFCKYTENHFVYVLVSVHTIMHTFYLTTDNSSWYVVRRQCFLKNKVHDFPYQGVNVFNNVLYFICVLL